jgi:hypothetical protein
VPYSLHRKDGIVEHWKKRGKFVARYSRIPVSHLSFFLKAKVVTSVTPTAFRSRIEEICSL